MKKLLIVLFFLFFPLFCFGADTGWKSPSDYSGYQSFPQWTNPANAYSSDDVWATSIEGQIEAYSIFGFGLDIGTGTIDGIEASIELHSQSADLHYLACYLSWDAGTSWTGYKWFSPSSDTDVIITGGGATDDWGRTWSEDNLSNANFKIRCDDGGVAGYPNYVLSTDHIQVKVYYTAEEEPPPSPTPTPQELIENETTGAYFYIDNTIDYGDLLIIIFLISILIVEIFKIIWNATHQDWTSKL